MDSTYLESEWNRVIAPRTGNVRADLVMEAAEFLGITVDEANRRIDGARDRFRHEWDETVTDPNDPAAVMQFYNQSDTELFELIEWHATDPIHYRTIVLRDLAMRRRGREYLDFGSGIGNDAVVFGTAGFAVTLADVSDCLLGFAAWRCRRRGIQVRTVDLKRETPPDNSFDVIVCFDVLEHIPNPLRTVGGLHRALRNGGLLAMHAPFGGDPERPMHVVHRDIVTPRMRSIGFQPVDCEFPPFVRAPLVYEKRDVALIDRAAYYVYDNYLNNAVGTRLAALYRRALGSSARSAT